MDSLPRFGLGSCDRYKLPFEYPHHFLDNERCVKQLTSALDGRGLRSAEYRSQEGHMAPKTNSKPARFLFAVGMALTVLAVMTWAMAQPSLSPIYHPQLLLLY